MKTKKVNKTLVWELERYRKAITLPDAEYESGRVPSPQNILSSDRGSRRDHMGSNKRIANADLEGKITERSLSPTN